MIATTTTTMALVLGFSWVILPGLTVFLLLVYVAKGRKARHTNMPPFPVAPWPLVGNLLHMEKNPRQQILKWRKEHGDIFTLNMAGHLVVFVHGFRRIKEIYVKNGHRCADRPVLFHDAATDTVNLGIGSSSGLHWKEERAIAYTILKSFGMGNQKRAENIEEEMVHFLQELERLDGKPTNLHFIIMKAVCNTVVSFLFGRRFEYEDKNFKDIVETIVDIIKMAAGTQILQFYPWLANLPGDLFHGKKLRSKILHAFHLIDEIFIASRSQTHPAVEDESPASNDYIHAYFRERERKEKSGQKTYMCTKTLLKSLSDLITAGTESTTTNLLWFVLFFIHYPEVQEKAFKEIEKHVGTERLPNMEDKPDLKYIEAVVMETQRLASITPYPIMHKCSNDIEIAGYTLPKGTNVSINLDSVFFDKKIWGEDVYHFRPERFLDPVSGEVLSREEFIPYSIGRRQCMAEAYAKSQLFMFISGMIQRFRFLPENPAQLPPMKDVFGLASPPLPYKVRVVDRRKML